MKPIEGQILLSIHQYFPTDYVRMAKKSKGMMNLFIENISEKVRKGIMDYNLESSSLEISNRAEPLFTLTAEEVETTRFALEVAIEKHKEFYDKGYYKMNSEEKGAFERVIYSERNLLNRIKQWQSENQ